MYTTSDTDTMPEVGVKRAGYGDTDTDSDVQKKPRQDIDKLRLLVLGRYAGTLIGKGGENFKRLREKYGVKITGLSSRMNERVIQLDGPRADCLNIVRELLPLCPVGRYPSHSGKSSYEVNMMANTDAVGILIGKGGSKIREITEQTGTKLKVYPGCLPNSNERIVSLGGENEDIVVQGLETVLGVLDTVHKRSNTVYFHPDKNGGSSLNTDLLGKGANGTANNNTMSGNSAQVLTPEVLENSNIAVLLVAQRNQKQQNGFDPALDFGSVQTVTTLRVSNELCGVIIGMGGRNIRYIKQVSGAQIDFKKCDDSEDRVLTMQGTQDEIQVAEQLMSQCVKADKRNNQRQPQQQQHQQQQQQQQPQSLHTMNDPYSIEACNQPWE